LEEWPQAYRRKTMPGKLPIDRVREGEDAPRVYEDHKQRFSEKQAKLRAMGSTPSDDRHVPAGDAPGEDDEG
jgi:hypothetical protein